MPTITHVFKTYFPDTQGGLEEAIRQIGKYSISQGFNVKVISVSKKPQINNLDGIECRSYKFSMGNSSMPISFELIKDFKKIVDESDIIQLHFPYPQGELLTLFHHIKKPVIVTFHCEILGRKLLRVCYEPFLEKLFNKVNLIVPTSRNLLNSTNVLRKFEAKTKVINLWLDNSRFNNIEGVSETFSEFTDSLGDFCLFVGVLRWYKGLDILIDAAKKTKGNIVIVGKGVLKQHLEERLQKENIKNVFLTGFLNDNEVFYLTQRCRFCVLPSVSPAEAFGQVLLEASYFSKAMISTELGTGTSYANKDQETGFVIPPNNSEVLAEKMNRLFTEKELCEKMGLAAHQRYLTHFTAEVQGQKYVDIYNELLTKK